jgi:hypothetical protein
MPAALPRPAGHNRGVEHGDDLPVIPIAHQARPAGARHRRNALALPALVAVAAFGLGALVGRVTGPGRAVAFSNPCPSSRDVSFYASAPGASPADTPVFSMIVPAYSTRRVPGAGRLRPGWGYTVPLPNTRPLGGRFQGQINRGDLATGTLWFPSALCNG